MQEMYQKQLEEMKIQLEHDKDISLEEEKRIYSYCDGGAGTSKTGTTQLVVCADKHRPALLHINLECMTSPNIIIQGKNVREVSSLDCT